MNVYLDHAATSELSASMKEYLMSILDVWGNPSSLHTYGKEPKQLIEKARRSVAAFIHACPDEIYFTPSGSASNALAIQGYCAKHHCTIFYSPIAHKSILKCVASYQDRHALKVGRNGMIDIIDLAKRLDTCMVTPLVIIDAANSEIGVIQDIARIIQTVHSYHGIIYLDCTGSIPQIPVNVKASDADMIGFSAHKLGGLKGCGVFYKKKSIRLSPLIYGSQESSLIGGTENVLGIASLGKAVENYDYSSISSCNRDYVHDYILKNISHSYLVGPPVVTGNRLPHNLYLCFKGVEGESLMILLDMNGIQVSTGSACNSQSLSPSPALSAIGMEEEDIHSCIRLTFNGRETTEELDYVCDTLKKCVLTLQNLN